MSCSVLIVEDSAILRAAIRKIVRLSGIGDAQIHEAGNGAEALEVLARTPIELVLLDLNMPVMDGEEFTRRLRRNPNYSGVAVVVVSTEGNRERLQRLRDLGALDTLHKPFEPEDLRRLLEKVIGAPR